LLSTIQKVFIKDKK